MTLSNQANSKLKEKNLPWHAEQPQRLEGFPRQQQQQKQEEEVVPQERQQVKQHLGRGVVHRLSWSKRRKNQDSALAAKLDKFTLTRVYLYTESYSQRG